MVLKPNAIGFIIGFVTEGNIIKITIKRIENNIADIPQSPVIAIPSNDCFSGLLAIKIFIFFELIIE